MKNIESQSTKTENTLITDCLEYINYLKVERVINDGHVHLAHLWKTYGREAVQAKLIELFNEQD
jgi:hypothetical protein